MSDAFYIDISIWRCQQCWPMIYHKWFSIFQWSMAFKLFYDRNPQINNTFTVKEYKCITRSNKSKYSTYIKISWLIPVLTDLECHVLRNAISWAFYIMILAFGRFALLSAAWGQSVVLLTKAPFALVWATKGMIVRAHMEYSGLILDTGISVNNLLPSNTNLILQTNHELSQITLKHKDSQQLLVLIIPSLHPTYKFYT